MMAKAARSSEKVPKSRAALTPEAREKQLIALAIDVAEEQMRNGTASSQVISHFLKLGSTRAQIEKELLEKQRDLAAAKAEAIESSAKIEDLYLKAAKAKDNEVDRSNDALFRAQKNTDSIVQDTDAMSVDHEYRLTLLELGLSE